MDEAHLLSHSACVQMQKCIDRKEGLTVASFLGGKSADDDDTSIVIPEFVLILATDQPSKLPKAIRSRLRQYTIEDYSLGELHAIVSAYYDRVSAPCTPQAANMISKISKGNPRVSITHAEGIWLHAKADGKTGITIDECRSYMMDEEIDEETGLEDVDIGYLTALYGAAGKPLGLRTISCMTSTDEAPLYRDVEPYLLKSKLVDLSRDGRTLTDAGRQLVERINSQKVCKAAEAGSMRLIAGEAL